MGRRGEGREHRAVGGRATSTRRGRGPRGRLRGREALRSPHVRHRREVRRQARIGTPYAPARRAISSRKASLRLPSASSSHSLHLDARSILCTSRNQRNKNFPHILVNTAWNLSILYEKHRYTSKNRHNNAHHHTQSTQQSTSQAQSRCAITVALDGLLLYLLSASLTGLRVFYDSH